MPHLCLYSRFCVQLHVLFLLLVIQLFALHAPLQQRVVLLTQQVDLTQEVVVLLFQVALQSTQQLKKKTDPLFGYTISPTTGFVMNCNKLEFLCFD